MATQLELIDFDIPYSGASQISVHEITEHIPDEVIDIDFNRHVQLILDCIDREAAFLRVPSLTKDEKTILVYEMYRTASSFQSIKRKTGEPTFFSHLLGSTRSLINDQGSVDLASILAILKHDWIEDLDGTDDELKQSILDFEMYRDLLTDFDDEKLAQLKDQVLLLVWGMTKDRRASRHSTKEATYRRKLETMREIGPRVEALKCADRTHNMNTLSGHKDQDKRKEIALETAEIITPFARVLRLREVVRQLTNLCVQHVNPDLFGEFYDFLGDRLKLRLDPYRDKILARLLGKREHHKAEFDYDEIVDVQFVPKGLDEYTPSLDVPLDKLTVDQLPIAMRDPMFEIVVLTRSAKGMKSMLPHINREFADDPGCKFDQDIPGKNDPSRLLGTKVTVSNPEYRGQLHFRVNHLLDERRSKKGIFEFERRNDPEANAIFDRIIAEMNGVIKDILDRKAQEMTGVKGVQASARQELLQPPFFVYDEYGNIVRLSTGATGFDFACAIHGDLFAGLERLYVADDRTSRAPEREVSIFEPLELGKQYIAASALEGENPDPSRINIGPKKLLFCQSSARRRAERIYRVSPKESSAEKFALIEEIADEYLEDLSSIFNVSYKRLWRMIKGVYPKRKDIRIKQGICKGIINPLKILVENIREQSTWIFEVTLPDNEGELDHFSKEFPRGGGFSLTPLGDTSDGDTITFKYRLRATRPDISTYEQFRKLVKLSFTYPIRLTGSPRSASPSGLLRKS